jgi:hypothetical protein
MKTELLIQGLKEIEKGTIPTDCVIDMVPDITERLNKLLILEDLFLSIRESSQTKCAHNLKALIDYQ